jgi:hypothetical protein
MADKSGFVTENLKKEFKILNKNSLLTLLEKKELSEYLIKNFFKQLMFK